MKNITKTKARYYARRLGIEIRNKNLYQLKKELMKIRSAKTNIKINITDQDILNIINTDEMDTENSQSHENINFTQTHINNDEDYDMLSMNNIVDMHSENSQSDENINFTQTHIDNDEDFMIC